MSSPSPSPAAPFFQGFNYGFLQKAGFYASPGVDRDIAEMADLGVTWVTPCVSLLQDNLMSTRLYRDFTYTAASADLVRLIDKFHKRGIKVLLKTTVETQDGAQRHNIAFSGTGLPGVIQGRGVDYWQPWFESYTQLAHFYARLAQDTGCEAYSVACELGGTERQADHWKRVIASTREIYSGHLTYNMIGGPNTKDPLVIDWLKACDSIGLSYYHGVRTSERPSPAEIAAAHREELVNVAAFAAALGRPVYFIECGARSVEGGLAWPWDYRNAGAYDGSVQADYYEGFLSVYWDEPWWNGYFAWKWDEAQDRPHYHQAGGDTGFTVRGKPAADVIKRWLGKSRA